MIYVIKKSKCIKLAVLAWVFTKTLFIFEFLEGNNNNTHSQK